MDTHYTVRQQNVLQFKFRAGASYATQFTCDYHHKMGTTSGGYDVRFVFVFLF